METGKIETERTPLVQMLVNDVRFVILTSVASPSTEVNRQEEDDG